MFFIPDLPRTVKINSMSQEQIGVENGAYVHSINEEKWKLVKLML